MAELHGCLPVTPQRGNDMRDPVPSSRFVKSRSDDLPLPHLGGRNLAPRLPFELAEK